MHAPTVMQLNSAQNARHPHPVLQMCASIAIHILHRLCGHHPSACWLHPSACVHALPHKCTHVPLAPMCIAGVCGVILALYLSTVGLSDDRCEPHAPSPACTQPVLPLVTTNIRPRPQPAQTLLSQTHPMHRHTLEVHDGAVSRPGLCDAVMFSLTAVHPFRCTVMSNSFPYVHGGGQCC